jgi:hypothetical protein
VRAPVARHPARLPLLPRTRAGRRRPRLVRAGCCACVLSSADVDLSSRRLLAWQSGRAGSYRGCSAPGMNSTRLLKRIVFCERK